MKFRQRMTNAMNELIAFYTDRSKLPSQGAVNLAIIALEMAAPAILQEAMEGSDSVEKSLIEKKGYAWVAHKLVGGPLDGKRTSIVEGDRFRREGALYERTDEHVIEGSFKLRIWRFVEDEAVPTLNT